MIGWVELDVFDLAGASIELAQRLQTDCLAKVLFCGRVCLTLYRLGRWDHLS
jgi:hypothetical protein